MFDTLYGKILPFLVLSLTLCKCVKDQLTHRHEKSESSIVETIDSPDFMNDQGSSKSGSSGNSAPTVQFPGPPPVTPYHEPITPSYTSEPVFHPCRACGGTGSCHRCSGQGRIYDWGPMSISSHEKYWQRCTVCGGSGICGGCDGQKGTYY